MFLGGELGRLPSSEKFGGGVAELLQALSDKDVIYRCGLARVCWLVRRRWLVREDLEVFFSNNGKVRACVLVRVSKWERLGGRYERTDGLGPICRAS